jgi:hypothetical protein
MLHFITSHKITLYCYNRRPETLFATPTGRRITTPDLVPSKRHTQCYSAVDHPNCIREVTFPRRLLFLRLQYFRLISTGAK